MLVGISGKRGVGKTLAAQHLATNHKFNIVSFAKPLKDMAKTMFPFTEGDLTSPLRKEKPFKKYDFSPREYMIHLGEFMRFHDPLYWLNRGMESVKDFATVNYVFDDVRYVNEANAIKAAGGMLLRIERYEKHNPYGKNLDTPSETELDTYKFDYTVERMWNIEQDDLFRQVNAFVDAKCHIKAV